MHKFYIHIEHGGVDQGGPVLCKQSEFRQLMAKIAMLAEEGASVTISSYDEEAAEAEYLDDVSQKPKPPFDHGYTTVRQFPAWAAL